MVQSLVESEIGAGRDVAGDGEAPAREFVFDPIRRELRQADGRRHLPPKSFDVLRVLVDRPGEIVTRDDLVAAVWDGMAVSSDAVRYTLRQLRKALGDPVGAPRFVETVARSGWRFVGSVVAIDDGRRRLLPEDFGATSALPRPIAPLVGRADEWSRLVEALALARGDRSQMLLVSGEAGIGKTRLLEDFLAHVSESNDVVVARGECIEFYGPGQPYLPLLEVLERVCLALGGELPIAIMRRHAPSWLAQIPALSEPEEREQLAAQSQGVTQARLLRELANALERLAERQSLVVWLDDLQWADRSTLEAVSYLARQNEGRGVLFLASLRPFEAGAMDEAFGMTLADLHRSGRCRLLEPVPLDRTSIAEYLGHRFGFGTQLADSGELAARLAEVSAGNPLFLVSIVDDLVDRGIIETGPEARFARGWTAESAVAPAFVPARIGPLIERQIDALAPDQRELLEVASVAGIEFSVLELQSVLAQEIAALERRSDALVEDGRFLCAAGGVAWPDGSVGSRYRFAHSLHRAALRSRLSPGRRSRIHRAIALRKEAGFADRAGEIASELALHFEAGLDPARAIDHLAQAGLASARIFANREALSHLRRALALVPELPAAERTPREIRLRLAICAPLAAVLGYANRELAENLERLAVLTSDLEDSPAIFPVLLGLWSLTLVRADLLSTEGLEARLLALAERDSQPIVQLQAHRAIGHGCFFRGDLVASERHLDRALAGYDTDRHERLDYSIGDDPVVLAHAYQSWTSWFLGRPERAVWHVEEAARIGERLAHPPSLAFALSYAAVLHALRGDVAGAWEWSDRAEELARSEGMALWLALSRIVRGWCLAGEGDLPAGIALLRDGLEGWQETGSELGRPYFDSMLAHALGRAGEYDEALAIVGRIDAVIERTGQWIFEPERRRVEAVLLSEADSSSAVARRAEKLLEEAIASARKRSALSLELRAALDLARLLDRRGEPSQAVRLVGECLASFSEGFRDVDLRAARRRVEGGSDASPDRASG